MISREELIIKYLDFFKKNNHKVIPSASLIPDNDPTVLFTTAGMHPLVPYLSGQKHPLGKKLCSIQKCLRTGDIDEVGDKTHHTFFEMLGNWSLGDYWKEESITLSFNFLTKVLKIPKEKLAVSCFKGDKDAPKDTESEKIWLSLGIPKERISFLGKEDNWWGPAGQTGPCGPDTEIFFWNSKEKIPDKFDPHKKSWVEIWNNVFMEYNKTESGKYIPLENKNVDTGMGVERTISALNGIEDNYETTSFLPIIKELEKISEKSYKKDNKTTKAMRIIADHLRAAVFILGDEKLLVPSNIQQGYVLRRIIRRAIRYAWLLDIKEKFTVQIAKKIIDNYKDYKHLKQNEKFILQELEKEEKKFRDTLEKGLNKFEKFSNKNIDGKEAFLLFQSFGFPIELTLELAAEKGISVDLESFNEEYKKHQDLSRTATSGVFKSGLADHSEKTIRMHTATHMMHEAMQRVLGSNAKQRGSNITPERIRFDFAFDRKLTEEEIRKIESIVNEKIKAHLDVIREEMPLQKALKSGAQGEFGHKYPDMVSVYTIVDKKEKSGFFSKEICTGPHVNNTKEIGKFKITKEESSSSGVRRIRAIVE